MLGPLDLPFRIPLIEQSKSKLQSKTLIPSLCKAFSRCGWALISMGQLFHFFKKGTKTLLDFSKEIIASRFRRFNAKTMFENEIFSDKQSCHNAQSFRSCVESKKTLDIFKWMLRQSKHCDAWLKWNLLWWNKLLIFLILSLLDGIEKHLIFFNESYQYQNTVMYFICK